MVVVVVVVSRPASDHASADSSRGAGSQKQKRIPSAWRRPLASRRFPIGVPHPPYAPGTIRKLSLAASKVLTSIPAHIRHRLLLRRDFTRCPTVVLPTPRFPRTVCHVARTIHQTSFPCLGLKHVALVFSFWISLSRSPQAHAH